MTNRDNTAAKLAEDSATVSIFPGAQHVDPKPLRQCTEAAMRKYFADLDDGHAPTDLYAMVLAEVEQPLLRTVMEYTRGNQSRAAQILGLNRSTLRKKLRQYGLHR